MRWKDVSEMTQKTNFIAEYLEGKCTVADLCGKYDISRSGAYKLVSKFMKDGIPGLHRRSTAPVAHPNATNPKTVKAIIALRKAHPRYGGKKIHTIITREGQIHPVPSVCTVNNIIKRAGLIPDRRRRPSGAEPLNPIFVTKEPGDIWSIDFKGKFKLRNGKYCYPLTVVDTHSCYVLCCVGTYKPISAVVKRILRGLFRKHGMPKQIHSDNGSPFGCTRSLRRLTRLSAWLVELGIEPVFSDPGKPQQNGRHERMHRELKAEATLPPCYDLRTQNRKMNGYIKEYNEYRPHEGLGMLTPADIYTDSTKKYPERIQEYVYPPELLVRMVSSAGAIRRKKKGWVMDGRALIHKMVVTCPHGTRHRSTLRNDSWTYWI